MPTSFYSFAFPSPFEAHSFASTDVFSKMPTLEQNTGFTVCGFTQSSYLSSV